MKKKVLALVLAALMAFTMLPLAAFAAEESEAEARVAAWNENYDLLLDKLLDGTTYSHYRYVLDNDKQIKDMMTVYTVFGLYDNAWKNGITKTADVDTCKTILVSMIEKQAYDMGKDYSEDILKVIDGAQSAGELIEKIQGFLGDKTDVLDFVESDTWGTVFQVLSYAETAVNTWQSIRAGIIKAMTEILSVQMANAYYLDMLDYIAANNAYEPMRIAAAQLKEEATTAINEQLLTIANEALAATGDNVTNILINLALDSNVYTATAKKVYNIATKVADILWNTGDQYDKYSALLASVYAEYDIENYVDAALAGDDADKSIFAINAIISVRSFGEDAIYNLKVAQSDGIVGKVKSKLNNAVFTEYTAAQAELDLFSLALLESDVADMIAINKIAHIYCPVNVNVSKDGAALFTVIDGAVVEPVQKGADGYAAAAYSTYNKEYIKVVLLADADDTIKLTGTTNGYVTYVEYVAEGDGINDYSFTEQEIAAGNQIIINGKSYTVYTTGDPAVKELNDDFVVPEGKTPTAKEVANAVVEVGKDEANNFLAKIKAFFQNLLESLKKIFSFGK